MERPEPTNAFTRPHERGRAYRSCMGSMVAVPGMVRSLPEKIGAKLFEEHTVSCSTGALVCGWFVSGEFGFGPCLARVSRGDVTHRRGKNNTAANDLAFCGQTPICHFADMRRQLDLVRAWKQEKGYNVSLTFSSCRSFVTASISGDINLSLSQGLFVEKNVSD